MSLTSQIITADFPDLDKVEALNNEAFPEEERIPLSEFLRYEDQEDANFFATTPAIPSVIPIRIYQPIKLRSSKKRFHL